MILLSFLFYKNAKDNIKIKDKPYLYLLVHFKLNYVKT